VKQVIGIIICAVLFALYGLLKPRGCTGHCTGCSNSCDSFKGHNHV